jgi:hypothetical protein
MALRDLIALKRKALCERWVDSVLAGYDPRLGAAWKKRPDPFTNPIAFILTERAPGLLAALAGEADEKATAAALEDVLSVRAVQDMAPSKAVEAVWRWREVLEEMLSPGPDDREELRGRVERLGLMAFDAYMRCRERVFRIRQDELKRSVASLMRRFNEPLDEGSVSGGER